MKTRRWNIQISALLLACSAGALMANGPSAGADSLRSRYLPWSRLWSQPAATFKPRTPQKVSAMHKSGTTHRSSGMHRPGGLKKTTAPSKPSRRAVSYNYGFMGMNVSHLIQQTEHPAVTAMTRSNYPLTRQLTSQAQPPQASPRSPDPTASAVFSRGGSSDPTAAKTLPLATNSSTFAPTSSVSAPAAAKASKALF